MSSTFKGSFGKKANAAPDMLPPSYATRPPKNHRKASDNIDSEEDEAVYSSHGDRGRSKQAYDNDSDEEEAPVQPERSRRRARSHGGRGQVDHNRADGHGRQRDGHDSRGHGTSQALVRREPSLSDEEPGPSRGHRGVNKSKALAIRGQSAQQSADEEETISIERFCVLTWSQMLRSDRKLVAGVFDIPFWQLKNYVDGGKIRMDKKIMKLDFELMYPLFPPHIVNRVKNETESARRREQEAKKLGGNKTTIIQTTLVAPTYRPRNPYLEPYYEPNDEYEVDDETYIRDIFNAHPAGNRPSLMRLSPYLPPYQSSPWDHDLNPYCSCPSYDDL
ncbi:hypothetical protein MMC34_007601 [Xylographa carneopallida]|nr:hypothetical protein [Xylographa carneopallida]